MNFTAWAIDTRSKEGHGLIGRYFFMEQPRPSQEGLQPSLFKTRDVARTYLRRLQYGYNPFPKARVIKVLVNISEVSDDKTD
jgi:hypothetical protein